MNKGMLTVGIILLAVISLLLINVITNYSSGGELDYYLVKETTEAAIEDSLDFQYYRSTGLLRMDKEKFVEGFIRRFADSVDNTRSYDIAFYDLNEVPPKVSVKVDSQTVLSFSGEAANISTSLDAIVESDYKSDPYTSDALKDLNDDLGAAIEVDSNNNITRKKSNSEE